MTRRAAPVSSLVLLLAAGLPAAPALAQGNAVYRCPGPPVLYTDALTPEEARAKGCRTIEGAPVTIVQGTRPRPPAGTAPAGGAGAGGGGGGGGTPAASGPRPADAKVDPAAQRQRDTDARRILEAELRREEDRLAGLKREYNNGEPERRGEERNYQTYLDRVAALKASIARSESDLAAIRRELAKLPPPPGSSP